MTRWAKSCESEVVLLAQANDANHAGLEKMGAIMGVGQEGERNFQLLDVFGMTQLLGCMGTNGAGIGIGIRREKGWPLQSWW